ncbi:hypothetical protein AB0C14_27140 [Microbispora hainanensis]
MDVDRDGADAATTEIEFAFPRGGARKGISRKNGKPAIGESFSLIS